MLQWRLVQSNGKNRGGALELVVYPGNSPSISIFLAKESPLCWAGLDPCALLLIEFVEKAKGINIMERKPEKEIAKMENGGEACGAQL